MLFLIELILINSIPIPVFSYALLFLFIYFM